MPASPPAPPSGAERPGVVFPIVLVPGAVVTAIALEARYDLFAGWSAGGLVGIAFFVVGAALFVAFFSVPFLLIALAILDGYIGWPAASGAFARASMWVKAGLARAGRSARYRRLGNVG